MLSGLAAAGGVFVACDGRNLPVGMMLPLAAHITQAERFAAQARAPAARCASGSGGRSSGQRSWPRPRCWSSCAARISASRPLVARVHSGDPSNVEARAARRYWPHVFADLDFRRHRENEDQNVLLNYGYAVLRAIVARAICAAGLHPSLGIHHHNRYNAFCLADDLMEPFRPTVDRAVAEYMSTHDEPYQLEAAAKQHIIGELTGRYDDGRPAADLVRHGRPDGRFAGRCFPGQCRVSCRVDCPEIDSSLERAGDCRNFRVSEMGLSFRARGPGRASPLALWERARVRACRDKNTFSRGIVECGCLRCSTCR